MSSNNKNKWFKDKKLKYIIICLVIFVSTICIFLVADKKHTNDKKDEINKMDYVTFIDHVDKNEVEKVEIIKTQNLMNVKLKDGKEFEVPNPDYSETKKDLLSKGVDVESKNQTCFEVLKTNLIISINMLFMCALIMFLYKSLNISKYSIFKVLEKGELITFDDVAGMSETKEEVKFAVEQIKKASELKELGAVPTRGIILEGPTGTGKTLLAKAIAGEANVPFISVSGSDFVQMFAGLGASRVRNLWHLAETKAPCVIFIDEIDAIGRKRNGGSDGASLEGNQTLNALLQRMDGINGNNGIFVVAATNRISDLDSALLRPGRFDKHLYIGAPKSKKDRDEIVELYLNNKKYDDTVNIDKASKLMFGMTGAEIFQTLNESVFISLRNGRNGVLSIDDIDESTMKIRSSGVAVKHTSDDDKNRVAVHEAGHAIMSLILGRKISKISIIPYSSGIGGATIPDTDDLEKIKFKSKESLEDDIMILLSGKIAEEIILGSSSNGCSNDIERASLIAYSMVNSYAMGRNIINKEIIGKEYNILVDTKESISSADNILIELYEKSSSIIENNEGKIIKLKELLIENETIIDYELDKNS